jgi:threonine dehydrogenase-like Zn-dependent dehydrogenase
VFIGLYIGDLKIDDPTFHKKETTLISSRNATREDFETVMTLFKSGLLNEEMMVNQEFDFYTFGHDYASAVANNKTLIKGIVKY